MRTLNTSFSSLEVLAAGRLPKHMLDAIDEMELTVEEVSDWNLSRPPFRLMVTNSTLMVEINWQIPIAKTLGFLASFLAGGWLLVKLAINYLPSLMTMIP